MKMQITYTQNFVSVNKVLDIKIHVNVGREGAQVQNRPKTPICEGYLFSPSSSNVDDC